MKDNFDDFLEQIEREQKKSTFYSVLDTIETFRQISTLDTHEISRKKDFYLLYYRKKNLLIKRKLEASTQSENEIIKKVCKSLACCSSLSQVNYTPGQNAIIEKTSNKCKNKYCLICSRINSNKKVQLFKEKISHPDHINFFKSRYFYFLTITLKHDEDTRNFNYLNEFRDNLNKLFRSVLYKNIFIQSKDKNNYGQMNSIEMTISKNQYHIHSHALICCHPLKNHIKNIEKMLSDKWKTITGDSTIIRLDLIKNLKYTEENELDNQESSDVFDKIAETFKYTVKSESLNSMKFEDTELIANWIIDTKGKNFCNAYGYFRRLKLVDEKKNTDENENENDINPNEKKLLSRTVDVVTNINLDTNYSKNTRKQMLTYFKINGIKNDFVEIDDNEMDLRYLLKSYESDEILNTLLPNAVTNHIKSNEEFNKIKDNLDDLLTEKLKNRKIKDNIGHT